MHNEFALPKLQSGLTEDQLSEHAPYDLCEALFFGEKPDDIRFVNQ